MAGDGAAPRGRDSIAQGLLALGSIRGFQSKSPDGARFPRRCAESGSGGETAASSCVSRDRRFSKLALTKQALCGKTGPVVHGAVVSRGRSNSLHRQSRRSTMRSLERRETRAQSATKRVPHMRASLTTAVIGFAILVSTHLLGEQSKSESRDEGRSDRQPVNSKRSERRFRELMAEFEKLKSDSDVGALVKAKFGRDRSLAVLAAWELQSRVDPDDRNGAGDRVLSLASAARHAEACTPTWVTSSRRRRCAGRRDTFRRLRCL